ncbi:hypothetical protein SALBM135S_09609 [Streptomyces alboniger]
MGTRRARTSRARQWATTASTASTGPETTTARGPFTAPTETRSHTASSMAASTSAAVISTSAMPPRPESRSVMTRLRPTMSRMPSATGMIPAAQAAVISPWEWPTTASGAIPAARHTSARDTCTANSAGCMTSMRSRASSSASASRSRQSTRSSSSRAHVSIRAAKTGRESHRSRAMPAHCGPCPGNAQTTPAADPAAPSITWGEGSPAARAARPARSSARSAATTTPRCANTDRVIAVAYPTSTGRRSGSASTRACSCRAWARSAALLLPDTTTGTASGSASAESSAGAAGASPTTTWQLVPPTPNELTPASRGPSGQGRVVSLTRSPSRSMGIAGLGSA